MIRFILHENDNLIAYGNLDNDKVEIELQPNCDKDVRGMWELLNKPIRRENEIHSRRKATRETTSKNVL